MVHAALISPMWLNACGKLPIISPLRGSTSSASSPTSLMAAMRTLEGHGGRLDLPAAGSSWLNQVEIWFGIITRQAIRRGTFSSVRVLTQAINNYIASWNEDSVPFEWSATADNADRNISEWN